MVAVEMVNYYGVFEKELDRAGTANETDHGYQRRYRGPLHRAAIRPCFSAPYFRGQRSKTRLTRLAATLRYRSTERAVREIYSRIFTHYGGDGWRHQDVRARLRHRFGKDFQV